MVAKQISGMIGETSTHRNFTRRLSTPRADIERQMRSQG